MRRQKLRIQGDIGRPWTILGSAPRAPKPQGAGSIPVQPAPSLEFMGLVAEWRVARFARFDPT